MKRTDLLFMAGIVAFFALFAVPIIGQWYNTLNTNHGVLMAFVKFALLATLGEVIAFRIKTGTLYSPRFGLLPRAIVWGFLGITIKVAFVVFASGTPVFLVYLGFENAPAVMKSEEITAMKILTAFTISTFMNLVYAPVMMTLHKITDTHIEQNNGKTGALLRKINIAQILKNIDWHTQWHFVFRKTIPFFWIPAHTITFLLPPDIQVLFAAFLGIALGVILASANLQ